jgi:hypothetical protein
VANTAAPGDPERSEIHAPKLPSYTVARGPDRSYLGVRPQRVASRRHFVTGSAYLQWKANDHIQHCGPQTTLCRRDELAARVATER